MRDRIEFVRKIKRGEPIDKVRFICDFCRGKKVLDLGCVRHSADYSLNDPEWVHKRIKETASSVLGVDYLKAEVEKLVALGYNMVYGDVTEPLDMQDTFDVIVAGDLIEHLTNFDGFLKNVLRLMKPDGALIITTPNPFFADLFFYCAYKKDVMGNSEHTCYLDPFTLRQLIARYNLGIEDMHYIKKAWNLAGLIFANENFQYDSISGRWTAGDNNRKSASETFFKFMLRLARENYRLRKYVLLPAVSTVQWLFGACYESFKFIFGLNSKLVKYSDYLAVIKRKHSVEENSEAIITQLNRTN